MSFQQMVVDSRSHQILQLYKTVKSNASPQRAHIPQQPTADNIPASWTQNFMAPGRPLSPIHAMGSLTTARATGYLNDPKREPRNQTRILDAKITGRDGFGNPIYSISTDVDEIQFTPRSYQYPPNINTTITPRVSYGLMPFSQIQELSFNTPDVMLCSKLLKREFSGLIPQVIHDDGDACDDPIFDRLLNYPDGFNPLSTWLGRWFYNSVIYDGACLHWPRDERGQVVAMVNVDASTIFTLVDENGNPPKPPAPAFLQIIFGTPYGFASTEQLWYRPNDLQISNQYGTALVESANLPATLLYNIWRYEVAWFTSGTLPEYVVVAPPGWNNEQIAAWLITKSEALAGHPELRQQFDVWPSGFTQLVQKNVDFRKELFDIAKREVMEHAGLPTSEIGETQRMGLGGRGFMDAMGQAFFRQAFLPWMRATAAPFNDVLATNHVTCKYGQDFHAVEWEFPSQSIDPEKQAKRMREQWESGGLTWGEYRESIGQNPFGNERDDLTYLAKGALLLNPDGSVFSTGVQVNDLEDPVHPAAVAPVDEEGKPTSPPESIIKPNRNIGKPKAKPKPAAAKIKPAIEAKPVKPVRKVDELLELPESGMGYQVVNLKYSDGTIRTRTILNATIDPIDQPNLVGVELVKAANHDGVMLALAVPKSVQQKLHAIAEQEVGDRGRLEDESQYHITLAYLGSTDEASESITREALQAALQIFAHSHAILRGVIGGVALFNPPDTNEQPLVAIFDCPELPGFRQDLIEILASAGAEVDMTHGFVPHITLAYLPKTAEPVTAPTLERLPVTFTDVVLAWGGDWTPAALELVKHCGVCPPTDELPGDDVYYGAPIINTTTIPAPTQGANETEIVAVHPSGQPARPFAWKAAGNENADLNERIGHPQYPAEEANYLLDRALQFYLVPVSFVAVSNGERGSAIHWVLKSGTILHPDEYDPRWIEKAAVLDFIAGQADRTHDPHKLNVNFLTHPDNPTRMILIDNGLSFPTPESDFTLASDFVNAYGTLPLSEDVTASLSALQENQPVWPRIGRLVGEPAMKLAKDRLAQLLHDGHLPPSAETSQRTGE